MKTLIFLNSNSKRNKVITLNKGLSFDFLRNISMGTWNHIKLWELPWHNSLEFFCWGRSLKIHTWIKRELFMVVVELHVKWRVGGGELLSLNGRYVVKGHASFNSFTRYASSNSHLLKATLSSTLPTMPCTTSIQLRYVCVCGHLHHMLCVSNIF